MLKAFSVIIAERKYHLEIRANDEEVMRRAAKQLNAKIDEMSRKYDCSAYDHLAMAALLSAIESEEIKLQQRYSTEQQEIDKISDQVRRALEDEF